MNHTRLNQAIAELKTEDVIFDMRYFYDQYPTKVKCCLGGMILHLNPVDDDIVSNYNKIATALDCSVNFVYSFYTTNRWQYDYMIDYKYAKEIEDKEGMILALENQINYLIEKGI